MTNGMFFLAFSIAAAGYFVGSGIGELGRELRKGMSALAEAIADAGTFDGAPEE